jgi:hypothetical protein
MNIQEFAQIVVIFYNPFIINRTPLLAQNIAALHTLQSHMHEILNPLGCFSLPLTLASFT